MSESADDVPETVSTYLRLRGLKPTQRGKRRNRRFDDSDENQPFTAGRDPRGLGDVFSAVVKDAGWDDQLAQEDVLLSWEEIAGAETAKHSELVGLVDGVLTIRCDSTAWAKNLQLMRSQIMTRIAQLHPKAAVETIRFMGPDVPSWKWGPRTIPGRGPRDTYG